MARDPELTAPMHAALRARMGAAANESTEKYALDRVLPEVLPHFTRH